MTLILANSHFKKVQKETDTFRPSDDIFEEAANKLQTDSHNEKETSLHLSAQDILACTSAELCQSALKHLCETQGISKLVISKLGLISGNRRYAYASGLQVLNGQGAGVRKKEGRKNGGI